MIWFVFGFVNFIVIMAVIKYNCGKCDEITIRDAIIIFGVFIISMVCGIVGTMILFVIAIIFLILEEDVEDRLPFLGTQLWKKKDANR